jgi:alkyldihydroxyacetonephosphate synthase
VSFRVTQLYETGAAVYVYFIIMKGDIPIDIAIDMYEEVEAQVRYQVMKYGGCISHHHGVGKLRKRFMEKSFDNFKMQK